MTSLSNLELHISASISKHGRDETICRLHTELLGCLYDGLVWDDGFLELLTNIMNKRLSTYVH
ncbi:MAG: hypothetical protein UX04_C0002G0209 [Microgenomates group bacterium GW2011_GWF2_45_18]|nr:MAG: hypothetical protein UW18_C0003G0353 [Microgenomates group bacterium GW2011_GWF1_44_10]KKU02066.1 MAG: hypothetical protein UX04_C0002G0209 [Microgenomates group bacterium GW2011_GWF2_45_18]